MNNRFLYQVLWIHKFEVKVMIKHRDCKPNKHLCEGLAKTNTFTTQERTKSERVAHTSIWSLVPFACGIEPCWFELLRTLPLIWVVMKSPDANKEECITFELDLVDCYILGHALSN